MKNTSIQKEFGWCNVHALANVFRDNDFKEFLSNDEYKSGTVDAMNDMLKIAGYDNIEMFQMIGIHPAYPPIPNDYLINILSDDNLSTKTDRKGHYFTPYFLTVQIKEPHWHCVALIKYNGKYIYLDSYNESPVVLSGINEIVNHFKTCIGIERIRESNGNKNFLLLDAEAIGWEDLVN